MAMDRGEAPPERGKRLNVHVQANLHPRFQEEAQAIAYFEKQRQQGYTPRQIVAHALNKANGSTPAMFPPDRDDLIMQKLNELEAQIIDGVIAALNELKRDPVQRQTLVNDIQSDNDLSDETQRNLMKAVTHYRGKSRRNR